MLKTKASRSYIPGKALSEDIRRGIIDTIVQNGGDHISGFLGGSYSDVARKFDVSRQSAKNVWKKIVNSGEIGPRDKKGAQNPPNLIGTEFEIIEFLKRDSPSIPLSKVYDVVGSYCAVPGGTSKAAVSRAIRKKMSCGPMTWKRTSNRPINKFSPENVNYCQNFRPLCFVP